MDTNLVVMKKILVITFCINFGLTYSQCNTIKGFKHYSIETKNDTINYHVYSKGKITSKKNILLFIHGSNSKPFYSFFKKDGKKYRGSTMPFDLQMIPEDYAFVIVSKKGVVFCHDKDEEYQIPDSYYSGLSLQYRANQIHNVINDITKRLLTKPNKIVVVGHSEGSDVVAKLGTINNKITHIGFWSGGGNSQWYDFPLFVRKDVLSGKITEEEGIQKIDSLLSKYKDIMKNKDDLKKTWYGHPYKRWYHFSESPIENLIQIDIPLYVAMGSKDTSVPIESTYLILVEFIRKGKENLTFKVYPNLNHSFQKVGKNTFERHWDNVFTDFLIWLKNN